ncbi:Gfo/Idh/MocA family oxidoreductase [candidate division KSB1 bacterium]|nr:Gfo/Idh/MocA family oxidoreductase [candidate division KSB1 bacterium]
MNEKSFAGHKGISRRSFFSGASAATEAATAFTIVPRHVLGGPGYKAPSDKLNIACIGVGGKGRSSTMAASGENIVALCDVDDTQVANFKDSIKDNDEAKIWFEKAKKYKDFRVMLDTQKDIDAVTVSTPDHTHAVAAMMALKMKKHVFVQKPLTHTIYEARALAAEAAKTGKKSTTDFSYSCPLTETMLLGCLAVRVKDKNTILEWDGEKGEMTNLPEVNEYLHMPYREGWTL